MNSTSAGSGALETLSGCIFKFGGVGEGLIVDGRSSVDIATGVVEAKRVAMRGCNNPGRRLHRATSLEVEQGVHCADWGIGIAVDVLEN